jgi:hypothetical protein
MRKMKYQKRELTGTDTSYTMTEFIVVEAAFFLLTSLAEDIIVIVTVSQAC